MSETPLDLDAIDLAVKLWPTRKVDQDVVKSLVAEVRHLRAEVERARNHESEVAEAVAHDMDLLTAANAENARLRDALDRVKAMHAVDGSGWCEDDGYYWPCRTARALAALTTTEDTDD